MVRKLFYTMVVLTVAVFVLRYAPVVLPHGQPTIGFASIQDLDADYLITLSIFRGEGLYSNFSIVYPPGRYIVQAGLFELLGPSAPLLGVVKIALTLIVFPAVLFVMAAFFFERVFELEWPKLKKTDKWLTLKYTVIYLLALLSTTLYLVFIRSAQESHVAAALFFSAFFVAGKVGQKRLFIAGILLGLAAWFRLDTGILLGLAGLVAVLTTSTSIKKLWSNYGKPLVAGISLVWLPTLIATIVNGSLFNFFYDVFILGLILQPKVMELPIPENDLKLVFWASMIFAVGLGVALFREAQNFKDDFLQLGVKAFAVFAALSYVTALGRSDEPHLWYGLVWLSVLVGSAIVGLTKFLSNKQQLKILPVVTTSVLVGIVLIIFSWTMLTLKMPLFFLVATTGLFIASHKLKIKTAPIIIGSIAAGLLIFHSLSYLKLRAYIFRPPSIQAIQNKQLDWVTSQEGEHAGFVVTSKDKRVLDQIRSQIPDQEKYIFIFPENLLLYEYFKLKNPTRYQLLSQTRSNHTEQEVLRQIEEQDVEYFLVFPEAAQLRGEAAWDWILKKTRPIENYIIGETELELRKIN